MEARLFTNVQKMGLIDESVNYQFLRYAPAVLIDQSMLDTLSFKNTDSPEGVLIFSTESAFSYAIVRKSFSSLKIVDFLIDSSHVELWDFLEHTYKISRFGGLHEFVKNNINCPEALDLAAVIISG